LRAVAGAPDPSPGRADSSKVAICELGNKNGGWMMLDVLVGGLEHVFKKSIIYGMSSFPLTKSDVSRWAHCTTNQCFNPRLRTSFCRHVLMTISWAFVQMFGSLETKMMFLRSTLW